MKERRFSPLLVLAVVAALLLGACSSGGDDDKADDKVETEDTAAGTDPTDGEDEGDTDEGDDTTTTTDDGESEGEGDGGGSVDVGSGGQAYVDAMIQSMKAEDDFPLSDDQAGCYASRFIDTIGVDRLQAAGITPDDMASDDSSMEYTELDLTEDEGNDLYDIFGDCGINLREMMLEEMAADEDTTPEMETCMEGVFTDENLRKLMVLTMTRGDDALENDPEGSALMAGLMGCAFMGMGEGDIGDMGEG